MCGECVSAVADAMRDGCDYVRKGVACALDPVEYVLNGTDSTKDLLQLVSRTLDLAGNFVQFPRVSPFVDAFHGVTGFISAKAVIGRTWKVLDGENLGIRSDAKESKPVSITKFVSNCGSFVSDVCSSIRWLAAIEFIDKGILNATGTISVFGRSVSFNMINKVQSGALIVSGVSGLVGNIRTIRAENKLRTDVAINMTMDITKIAASILLNVPGAGFFIAATAALAIGNIACLTSTIHKGYFSKPKDSPDLQQPPISQEPHVDSGDPPPPGYLETLSSQST